MQQEKGQGAGSGVPALLLAPRSPKPGLGADLTFHLSLASTRKSLGTLSAGSGDSANHWLQLWVNPRQAGSAATPRGSQKQCWVSMVGSCLATKRGCRGLLLLCGHILSHPTLSSLRESCRDSPVNTAGLHYSSECQCGPSHLALLLSTVRCVQTVLLSQLLTL